MASQPGLLVTLWLLTPSVYNPSNHIYLFPLFNQLQRITHQIFILSITVFAQNSAIVKVSLKSPI